MENKTVNILIINIHSSCNAGDLALLECGLRVMRAAFENPRLVVCANWPDEDFFNRTQDFEILPSARWLIGVDRGRPLARQILSLLLGWTLALLAVWGRRVDWFNFLAPAGWRRLINAYQQADIVAAVSGNQFYSSGRFGWPFPVTCMAVMLAHLFKKPFYVLPQSIGPLKRGWERLALGRVLGKARVVYLRDAYSLRLAADINLPDARVKYAPDPAIDLTSASPEKALQVLKSYSYKPGCYSLGVTLIAPMGKALQQTSVENYYSAMAHVMERAARTFGARVYIFIQVTGPTKIEDDRLATKKVFAQISNPVDIVIVDEVLPPALLKACFGQMDFFLASRLHSGIFALGMGVPTLFIGYLSKTRGMLEALGLSNWVVDLAQADKETLWTHLNLGWRERKERAALLQARLPNLKTDSHQVEGWIGNDYGHFKP